MQTATLTGVQATPNVGTSLTPIGGFVAPAGGATVTHLMVAYTLTGGTVNVDVSLYNGSTDVYIARNYPLGPGDTLNLSESGARFTLQQGWGVRVRASGGAACDATMSVVSYS